MKTKTIKKLNLTLLVFLGLFFSAIVGFVVFRISQGDFFYEGIFAGKAQGLLDQQSKKQTENIGEENEEAEKKNDVEIVLLQDSGQTLSLIKEDEGASVEESENDKQKQGYAKFSFAVFGDSDSKDESLGFSSNLDLALGKAKGYSPDLVLFSGDVLRVGKDGEAQSKSRIEGLKSLIEKHFNNYYFTFGNHDIECGKECIKLWEKNFFATEETEEKKEHKLYHSFDFQNTHFVLLSTEYPKRFSLDQEQLRWLESDLEKNELQNVVVVQHTSPVSFFEDSQKKCHGMSCDEQTRRKLLELYKKHKVDLVISGTEEVFDHKIEDGTHFILSGSIGKDPQLKGMIKGDVYVFCSVNGDEIQVEAINTQGSVIRQIKVE